MLGVDDINRLQDDNKRLNDIIDSYQPRIQRYKDILQEIKDYLNTLSGIDNDFVNTETYLRILDLITKAEEEWKY